MNLNIIDPDAAHPLPTVCQRKNCEAPARYLPVIRIPAKGCPLAEHEPLAVIIELPLCERHSNTMKAAEFINQPLRRRVKHACGSLRKAEPDFKRAFVQRKDLQQ